jgi:hypothetical protein
MAQGALLRINLKARLNRFTCVLVVANLLRENLLHGHREQT